MAARDPAMRKSIATEAALIRWSREDGRANAERAQQGLRDKFVRQVRDEQPGLTETETLRRADCAYRAHMVRIRRSRRPDREAAA